jgi:mRNA interferase MazF
LELRRGAIITIAPAGDFSKPRPAVVLQNFSPAGMETVTVVPVTSDLKRLPDLRVPVNPSTRNGLRVPSELMTDNVQTVLVKRVGGVIGQLDEGTMQLVTESVSIFLGFR